MPTLTVSQALREALTEEMRRDERVFLLGQDIGGFGGPFGVTTGLIDEFGPERVVDTPIAENAMVGVAVGAALAGQRPVVEVQFSDFLAMAMDQIANQAAKLRLMSGGQAKVPLVMRAPTGATNHGAQHAQSLQAWFMHVPGLKVVEPATAYDAKGLLKAAIRDDNPVIFFEHKYLYGSRSVGGPRTTPADRLPMSGAEVPEAEYVVPLGAADVKRAGRDVTVVAHGFMVQRALAAARLVAEDGIDAEVVDLRTLAPLDKQTIVESARKTHRAVVVTEDCLTGGIGAEVASVISAEAFDYLDAPVVRLAGLDTPMPFAPIAQAPCVPDEDRIAAALREVCR
jgi:pyruvate dehydrogenase E1 component beta subunit